MATSTEAPSVSRSSGAGADVSTRSRQSWPVPLGPLLAVCGLAGGAGATTVAYLVALTARRQ